MKTLRSVIALVAITSFLALPAWADCDKCSMKSRGGHSHGGYGQKEEHQCPVIGKFMEKAHFIMNNKDELALTEEQIAKIKELKLSVSKIEVREMADMQIWMLDLDAKMSEPKVDVEGIGTMIDQGSAEMAASTKKVVQAYADLKAVLTDEQMAKLKAIWWGKKK